MNPYSDPELRAQILEMQLEVNAASQAMWAARAAKSPDAEQLAEDYRELNRELAKFIADHSK